MSTLKVDTITKADGTGSLSVPAESGTVVTTASPSLGRRNLIINGDMRIDQRNAGASVTVNANAVFHAVDRFGAVGQGSDGVFTIQQSTTAPAGFYNSVVATVTTADASIGSVQEYGMDYQVEGYDVAHLNFGTADAQTITLSFWVRSSLTGTFGGSLRNSAANRSYPFSYSISSADTWEQKTVTISGDTSGTWLKNNMIGMMLFWSLGTGSSLNGTAGAWAGTNYTGVAGQTNLIGTNGATFYITGVQLEVGSVATPFEHRSYGEELALCQRYFINFGDLRLLAVGSRTADTGGIRAQSMLFPCAMRTQPSASYNDGYGNSAKVSMQPCDQNTETQTNLNLGLQYNYQGISGLISYNTNMGVSLCQVGIARLDDVTFDAEL